MEEFDVAIIGAGSAGLVARRQALAHGAQRVLLIEGGPYGTTCARVGCMPSKLLIAAASAAQSVREAAAFGVHAEPPRIDGAEVMARVQRERDRFVSFVVEASEQIPEPQRLRGWARFVGPTRLELRREGESMEVQARTVVIAAGSTPHIPASLQGLGDRLLTSDTIFELPTLPRSLAVVGVGVIGLELGQAMAQLGVRTTLFSTHARMPLLRSEPMQAEARAIFEARLDLRLGVHSMVAERHEGGGVRLGWTDAAGEAQEGEFEYVLATTGRRPQLARLELERAGLKLDARGVPLGWDERTGQIGDSPIFMAGDITGTRALLHEAATEGRIAGTNAARYPDVRALVRTHAMAIAFCEPNVAVLGTIPGPEGEGVEWEVGEVDYAQQGRARVMNQNHGRVRIYARHECGTLIGAELIGPRVEHLAHLLAWAIEQRMSATHALGMPYYHPVIEEGVRSAIAALVRKLKMGPRLGSLDCGPGV